MKASRDKNMTANNKTIWKNRIVGTGQKAAKEFTANPHNWRTHPDFQASAAIICWSSATGIICLSAIVWWFGQSVMRFSKVSFPPKRLAIMWWTSIAASKPQIRHLFSSRCLASRFGLVNLSENASLIHWFLQICEQKFLVWTLDFFRINFSPQVKQFTSICFS